jgi:TetR/AcrR family transcriptional regulator, mexJK operon transcriptional repressor
MRILALVPAWRSGSWSSTESHRSFDVSTGINRNSAQAQLRRGRPTREEGKAIDRMILDAARKCLLERGFDGTPMEVIARSARVTKTTLYLRYPDKRALLRAVLEDWRREWGGNSRKSDWMMGETLESTLKYFAQLLVKRSVDQEVRSVVKFLDSLYGAAGVVGEEYSRMLRRPMLERIAQVIADFGAKDRVPVRDAEAAAATFMGMLLGYRLMALETDSQDAAGAKAFADYAVDLFLKGRQRW